MMVMTNTKRDIKFANLTTAMMRKLEMESRTGAAGYRDRLDDLLNEAQRIVHRIQTAWERQPLEARDRGSRRGLAATAKVTAQKRVDPIVGIA